LGPMDNMEAAAANLARAASLPGDPKLTKPLKLRDGSTVDAGATIASALESIRKYRGQEVSKVLPDLAISVPPPKIPGAPRQPHPKAFLPRDEKRDVIGNIKALLQPVRDFGRSDRVVAFTSDNVLDIFEAGKIRPLSTSHAVTDEPKAC